MESISVRDELVLRAQTYSALCSLLLQAPDADVLRSLKEAYAGADGKLAAFVAALPADAEELERVRVDVEAEFSALLLNMSANPVFPYESAYVEDPEGTVGGIRSAVAREYGRAGFQVGEEENLPADHLGVEMAFMARLAESRVLAIDAGDETRDAELADFQVAFLREHLVPGARPFCAALAERAKSDFYRGVAEEIEGFLAFEMERAR